jgi:hypothetical protein
MVAQPTAGPGQINHPFLDPYSFVHAAVGVLALLALGLGFWATLAVAVSWEVVEHALKNLIPGVFPHPTQDTLANSAGDVLSTMLGWSLARLGRARRHPAGAG